jgi:tetratricopeptide (TPR) repeat protein
MNSKTFFLLLLVLCFAVSFSGLCAGENQKTALTVKKIAFTRDKDGGERIALFCNQACVPELSSIEGENPRVVMDMKGVFQSQSKARNVKSRGKLVKKVRSYLDKKTKILRVVLDMEPSKYYIVRPKQAPSGNMYVLTIHEDSSLSQQKPGGNKDAKGFPLSQEMRITILRPDLRPEEQKGKLPEAVPSPEKLGTVEAAKDVQSVEQGKSKPDLKPKEQEGKLQEAAPSPEKLGTVKAAKDVLSVDRGRSQLNAGEFAAAVDTFTQILAAHPQDSLSYHFRGNAYDNLADRQKAVEDWTQAARLGDTTLQSYLDFLQVKWRENPAP